MQILLADESRTVRAITRAALQQTRFANESLREAESGDQVMTWIHMRAVGPSLLVIDWDLPGMGGLDLMDRLEELGLLDEIGVLFCVNRAQTSLAQAAVDRGARGYIVRPFSDDDLRGKLDAIAARELATRSSQPSDILKEIVTTVRARQELPSILSLPSSVISELFTGSTRLRHATGETLVWPGQGISSLSFITAGEVDVCPADQEPAYIRGTGDCFAERAFVCGEPSRVTVRARTTVDVLHVPKVRMVELARRHASVRAFLAALLEKPGPAAVEESELTGTLESLPFADLLQFLNATRKTGLLLLEEGAVQGVLYFSRGEVHDAQVGDKTGEEAFFEMSRWARARFDFRAGESAGQRTLERPTLRMLMEAYDQTVVPAA
jgi:CheY-like chemotaxis protein/CRP-like cAMP-binding protein